MGHPSCSKDHTICLQKDLLCTSLITLCKKGWMYDTRTNLWQATLKDYVLAPRNSYISTPLGKSHTKDFVTTIGHSLVLYLTFNSHSKDRACSVLSSNRSLFGTSVFRRLVTELQNLVVVTLLSLNYLLWEKVIYFDGRYHSHQVFSLMKHAFTAWSYSYRNQSFLKLH